MRTPARIVLISALAWMAAGCSRASVDTESDAPRVDLIVYAATSTRDALQELGATFEREHAVDLVFNFGSSGDLSKQILAAGKADVFLSADEREMDRVDAAGMLAPGTRSVLLSNRLVVVEPSDGPSIFAEPFTAAQLTQTAVKWLSIGNVETVPAGRYARAWLSNQGVWDAVATRVLPGVDARAALAAVESGGAEVGIVYSTDAARSNRVRVVYAVPLEEGPRIAYPIAAIANRPAESTARAWLAFVGSGAACTVWERHGFERRDFVPPSAAPAAK